MKAVRHSPVAFLAALLALVCQLLAASPAQASPSTLPFGVHICAAASPAGAPHNPAPAHPDCEHCPLCAGLAAPAAVLAPSYGIVVLRAATRIRFASRAGGVSHRPAIEAARPRGPPILT